MIIYSINVYKTNDTTRIIELRIFCTFSFDLIHSMVEWSKSTARRYCLPWTFPFELLLKVLKHVLDGKVFIPL